MSARYVFETLDEYNDRISSEPETPFQSGIEGLNERIYQLEQMVGALEAFIIRHDQFHKWIDENNEDISYRDCDLGI